MTLAPYWTDGTCTLYLGDCLAVLGDLDGASFDAVVTDPPYGLEFMGAEWDSFRSASARIRTREDQRTNPAEGKSVTSAPESYVAGSPYQEWCAAWAAECLRVLKPGGHLLAFGGTRTWHRLACAIEDAGFEIRDSIDWIFAQGFPKSLDVSKAIDKAAGLEREVIGVNDDYLRRKPNGMKTAGATAYGYSEVQHQTDAAITAPASPEAARWEGYGTALKPAHEPIILARKPLAGSVVRNVLEHGTGALSIAACRVDPGSHVRDGGGLLGGAGTRHEGWRREAHLEGAASAPHDEGRWPPNILLTHSAGCELAGTRRIRGDSRSGQEPGERQGGFADIGAGSGSARPNGPLHGGQAVEVWACAGGCPVAELDRQSGIRTSGDAPKVRHSEVFGDCYGDFAGQRACPPGRPASEGGASRFFPAFRYEAKAPSSERPRGADGSAHPTVKPVDLMCWLVRLVTRPGALILDPFAGSGTTGEACVIEGRECTLIEKHEPYADLIRRRLSKSIQPALFDLTGEAAR